MARLSQEKIDEIRQSVDIVDVMGQYLELHKKGKNYMAICPFHDDNHPSLSISQSRQIYKCFVCGNGGNVFTFIQEYLKVPFVEAVMKVAEFGHVDMSGYSLEKRVVKVDEALAPLYDMHAFALKLYMYYLYTQSGKQALDYLRHRGLMMISSRCLGLVMRQKNPFYMNVSRKKAILKWHRSNQA